MLGGRRDEVVMFGARLRCRKGSVVVGEPGWRQEETCCRTPKNARPQRIEIGEFTSWNAHMPEKAQDGLSLAGLSWGMREIVSVAAQ